MQPICTHAISVQSSKPLHAYPIIRLPRECKELAGSKADMYQTTHEGNLAFLANVIDHPQNKPIKSSNGKEGPQKGRETYWVAAAHPLRGGFHGRRNCEEVARDTEGLAP